MVENIVDQDQMTSSDLDLQNLDLQTSPEVIELFMLNSTEHEISTTHKKLKY